MNKDEFERMLDAMLPATARTALILTEVPKLQGQLEDFLEQAIVGGRERQAALTEIHLPRHRFPQLGFLFQDVPVEDSGVDGVLRLFFQPTEPVIRQAA
jgi:hypothetical protein